jgi:hypothetical protein
MGLVAAVTDRRVRDLFGSLLALDREEAPATFVSGLLRGSRIAR